MRGARHLAAVVLSGSLLLGTAATGHHPSASAQEFQVGQPVVVTVAALNVRDAPTLSGSIVTVLLQDEVVSVVSAPTSADGYDWYQIQRAGVYVGWAVNGFIPGSAGSGGAEPPTTPGDGYTYGASVAVTASLLNVRALPSLSADVLSVYAYGRVATITGEAQVADNITWYPVDNFGWVSGEYLQPSEGGTPTSPTSPTSPTTPPTTGTGTIFTVDADALNVRSTPGLTGTILKTVLYGTQLTQSGNPTTVDGILWFPVDNLGWVSGQFLQQDVETVYVLADVLNIRSAPSTGGSIVGTLTYGQAVTIFANAQDEDGATWYAIDAAGTQWVSGQFVTIRL